MTTEAEPWPMLMPCPFCGEQPEMETIGTGIDIDCCVSMSIQKSDYLTIDERQTWRNFNALYSDAAEEKTARIAIEKWNTRHESK